jgi:hypothetical protein
LIRHLTCAWVIPRQRQVKDEIPDARRAVQRAQERIERMMKRGKPNCGCANDPAARHGPYYAWGRMRAGKQTQGYVNATPAQILRQAIANCREVRRLLREWEEHTERLIDAPEPKPPKT